MLISKLVFIKPYFDEKKLIDKIIWFIPFVIHLLSITIPLLVLVTISCLNEYFIKKNKKHWFMHSIGFLLHKDYLHKTLINRYHNNWLEKNIGPRKIKWDTCQAGYRFLYMKDLIYFKMCNYGSN